MSDISEPERLLGFYDFDLDVVERVGEVADKLRTQTWDEIQRNLPPLKTFTSKGNKPLEVLDIQPDIYDATQVYHLPMGNPLAANRLLRFAALSEAEPNKRIIAVGNPGHPGRGEGKTKINDFADIWKGDLRATIDSTLRYLDSEGILVASHVGFSYGVERAITAAIYADKYDLLVSQSILIEPPSVKKRSLNRLLKDFSSAVTELESSADIAAFLADEETAKLTEEESHGRVGYALGLMRLTNIAIAHAIGHGIFENRVELAMTAQHEMQTDIIWGTESELAINGLLLGITDRLVEKYGSERVRRTVLEDQRHITGDNVFLHTALVLQSLKNKS